MPDRRRALSQPRSSRQYYGEVIYIYAFDLAYDMQRRPLPSLLGQPPQEYEIGPSKRNPKQLFFYKPQMVMLLPEDRIVKDRSVQIRRVVKVFSIGAISIQIRVPFESESLESLVDYHNLQLKDGSVEQEARVLAEQVLDELRPYCIRPVTQLGYSEGYTVFCLQTSAQDPSCWKTERWLQEHRRAVAALLTEEPDASDLSEQEMAESTHPYLSYYDNDLVVADWDAALVIGDSKAVEDVLHIMEVANVQLLELEAYDRILDGSLERAYRDLSRTRLRFNNQIYRNLRELRVDMARFSDELLNITKFFGDWHLARIYQHLSDRFHLNDWFRITEEKLKTLADLYHLLQQDRVNAFMMVLEIMIVLLFIIDVLLVLRG